jgi:chemotaxis protein MotA
MTKKEFNDAYAGFACKAILFAEKARREGLLALEEELEDYDEKFLGPRDIFKLGLRLVIDGTDKDFIDRILSNIVDQEEDPLKKRLKVVQKEAVLSIQSGTNPRLLVYLLNSLTDLSWDEDPLFKAP